MAGKLWLFVDCWQWAYSLSLILVICGAVLL
jgi:hypothetical protein